MAITLKQQKALEMLTCGLGYDFKTIAAEVGVTPKSLWSWRNDPSFKEFQDELKRLNDLRWQAAEDAARESCISLCREGNQKMVEFVLKNAGYNPTTKLEGNVSTETTIKINIDED